LTAAAPTLRCPHCGYDLSGIAGDSGECPECGAAFSRLRLQRRADAFVSLALNLTVYSAAALVLAQLLAQCIGAVHSPSESPASALLSLLPAAFLALGVALLSSTTGRTALSRGWPSAIAVVFAGCSIFAVAFVTLNSMNYPNLPSLLQPYAWMNFNLTVLGPARPLMIVAGAAVLRRTARSLDAHRAAHALALCIVLGTLAAGLHIASSFRDARPGTRVESDYLIDSWIVVLTTLSALSASFGVVGAGLFVRNQWLAALPTPQAPPRHPEPNPPLAPQ
jgi:hypothetical protein